MRTLTLFNHKGGVGKTTLTVNLADAFADLGETILLVDTDPQCNLSAFYLTEDYLDQVLAESRDAESSQTVWSAVLPVVQGRGDIRDIEAVEVQKRVHLLLGDVWLSEYEDELPSAWTESFARKGRGYDLMSAVTRVARNAAKKVGATLVMYDVGPNVGPLNRSVLLDSDYFATPVHTDLYSLRALATVGHSLARWIRDWRTVQQLAGDNDIRTGRLLSGRPHFLGYIASAYQTYGGNKAKPHAYWEQMLPSRVKTRVVDELRKVDAHLVRPPPYKLGDIPNFHSLAASAQEFGLAVGKLRGSVHSGHNAKIDEIGQSFNVLARDIKARMEG